MSGVRFQFRSRDSTSHLEETSSNFSFEDDEPLEFTFKKLDQRHLDDTYELKLEKLKRQSDFEGRAFLRCYINKFLGFWGKEKLLQVRICDI